MEAALKSAELSILLYLSNINNKQPMERYIAIIYQFGTTNHMKYLLFLPIFLLSFNVAANSAFPLTEANAIIIHDSGQEVWVGLENQISNSESCSNNSLLILKKTHASFSEMYSALLSAYHSGTKFKGWVDGCHRNAPVLTRLDLIK